MTQYEQLIETARQLASDLSDDIEKARDRESHIRVTQRANSALQLYNAMTATEEN